MTDPRPLLYALHALAAALAWGYRARSPRHLPIALWTTLVPVAALVRRSSVERHDPLWIARTLYLAAPASVAVVAVVVFLRQIGAPQTGSERAAEVRNKPCNKRFVVVSVFGAWLAVSALAARRVETPVDLYLAAHLGAVAVGLGAALARGAQRPRRRPDITDFCAGLLVAWWGCDLGGAYLFGDPIGDHWITQLVAGVALIVLCGMQGGALWLPRR